MGLQSTLEPISSITNGFFSEGITADNTGLSTPSIRPSINVDAVSTAPVFPADTKACAFFVFTSSNPTWIDEFFFFRNAFDGESVISMMSSECSTVIASLGKFERFSISFSSCCLFPTKMIFIGNFFVADMAPSMFTFGKKSPPIASKAIVIN